MLERPDRAHFAPLAQVFPGGSVDPDDLDPEWERTLAGADPARDPREGLGFRIAAIRETFEECGVLLACGATGSQLASEARAELASRWDSWRRQGALGFRALLAEVGAVPAVSQLVFCAHWITPLGLHHRFDARFFLARAPEQQEPITDPLGEHLSWRWATPDQVLDGGRRGEFQLLPPTRAVLGRLAVAKGVDDALDRARREPVATRQPTIEEVTQDRYPGLDVSRLESR